MSSALAVAPDLRPVQASSSAAAASSTPEELLATEHSIQRSNALAEVGLRQYLVNVLVGDDMVQSSGVEGGRFYIWDIPMSRQLEMEANAPRHQRGQMHHGPSGVDGVLVGSPWVMTDRV